jgi:mycobactin phenyloxazoline synthetase
VRPELAQLYVAPRTPIEYALAKIWSESLSVDHVGVNDPFFEIGGDSLLASTIVSKVNRIFTVDLAPHALFQADTVASFSTVVIGNGANVERIEAVARTWLRVESVSVRDFRNAIAAGKKTDNAG